jgi:hypothetical protein
MSSDQLHHQRLVSRPTPAGVTLGSAVPDSIFYVETPDVPAGMTPAEYRRRRPAPTGLTARLRRTRKRRRRDRRQALGLAGLLPAT